MPRPSSAANLRPLVELPLQQMVHRRDLRDALLLKPLWILAQLLSFFDRYVIDGLVFMVGFAPQLVGYSLKPTQRGLLQRYAVGMIAGLAALVLGVLYLLR